MSRSGDKNPEAGNERVVGSNRLAEGRFISLRVLDWIAHDGVERTWETAERVNFHGAVLVVARLVPSDRIILIRQYRPPARRHLYEFPAGLINAGERPEAAAARELREETGYAATRLTLWPPAYTTPGMSDESVYMVEAEIDETAPENVSPRTKFDDSEMIETLLVESERLPAFMREVAERGDALDAKLTAYILGRMARGDKEATG